VTPDIKALNFIYELENNGWQLVATTPATNRNALRLQENLKKEHGEIVHYIHNAWEFGTEVGINLYFAKDKKPTAEANTGNHYGMTDNEEQLVADLAATFSEEVQAGKNPSLEEYIQRLPSGTMQKAFRPLANMSKFLTFTRRIKEGETE
jgi:hypothetical protein